MAKIELKYIFIFNTITAGFFGLGFMIFPAFMMDLVGLSDAADGPTSMRSFGIMITGMGILVFGIRNEPHSPMRQVILIMLVFNFLMMTIFHFVFFETLNFWVWSVILLHILFVILYGYFFITSREK